MLCRTETRALVSTLDLQTKYLVLYMVEPYRLSLALICPCCGKGVADRVCTQKERCPTAQRQWMSRGNSMHYLVHEQD